MKQTLIRVTRVTQVKVTEYVDVTVFEDKERTYPDAETLAKDLVEAQIAAGQNITWFPVSSEIQSYPSPSIIAAKPEIAGAVLVARPSSQAAAYDAMTQQTPAAPEAFF